MNSSTGLSPHSSQTDITYGKSYFCATYPTDVKISLSADTPVNSAISFGLAEWDWKFLMRSLDLFYSDPIAFIGWHFKSFKSNHIPCVRSHEFDVPISRKYSERQQPHVLDLILAATFYHINTGGKLSCANKTSQSLIKSEVLPAVTRFLDVVQKLPDAHKPRFTLTLQRLLQKKDLHLLNFLHKHPLFHDLALHPSRSSHATPALAHQSTWRLPPSSRAFEDTNVLANMLCQRWPGGIDWNKWFQSALPKLQGMNASERESTERLWWQSWFVSHSKAFVSRSVELMSDLDKPTKDETHKKLKSVLLEFQNPLNHLLLHTHFRPHPDWVQDGMTCLFAEIGRIQQRNTDSAYSHNISARSALQQYILRSIELAQRDALLAHANLLKTTYTFKRFRAL